jgi:hypothetical protein
LSLSDELGANPELAELDAALSERVAALPSADGDPFGGAVEEVMEAAPMAVAA